ncbi:hypothetical protein AB205_0150540, partial [Aquarana catesbeiana]
NSSNVSENETGKAIIRTFRASYFQPFEPIPIITDDQEESTTSNDQKVASEKQTIVNNSTLAYLRSSTSTKLIPSIYIIVILIGIPANTLILWMLFSKTKTVCTAIFYTNLAISDLLFCLMLPFKATYHLNGNNWIFGKEELPLFFFCCAREMQNYYS